MTHARLQDFVEPARQHMADAGGEPGLRELRVHRLGVDRRRDHRLNLAAAGLDDARPQCPGLIGELQLAAQFVIG